MMVFLRLIRWPNLVIVAAVQLLIRYCVILPLYQPWISNEAQLIIAEPSLSGWQFLLLVLSTVLITAAGFLINDYFDFESDATNKPYRSLTSGKITAKTLFIWYWIFNAIGIGFGLACALFMGKPILVTVQLLTVALLWFYSAKLKKVLLWGNFLVAGVIAMSIFMVAFYEIELLRYLKFDLMGMLRTGFQNLTGLEVQAVNATKIKAPEFSALIMEIIAGFSFFAFLVTLAREWIKDAEDYEGDLKAGYSSLAIKYGIPISNLLTSAVLIFVIYLLFKFQLAQIKLQQYGAAVVALFGQFILGYVIFKLRTARQKDELRKLTHWLKAVMFLGLLYLPYFKTTINYQPGTIELPKGVHVDDVTVGFDNNNNQGNNTHQTDTTANLDSIIFNTQDKLEIEVPRIYSIY